jgi:imidazolonepropionase
MLPQVQKQGIARFCDVFCETGVFSIEQSRRLLKAAQAIGLGVKIHADEVNDLGGAGLAAELGACSADHLLAASETNIKAMAKAGVIATLLPATAYSLRKDYARARLMIENNVPVALATDCNPGSSFTESMQFVISLAVLNMQMTPAEALTGATLNSAYAINMADKAGSLERGKQADFLLLDGDSPAILAYHAGVSSVARVYKKGQKIKLSGTGL